MEEFRNCFRVVRKTTMLGSLGVFHHVVPKRKASRKMFPEEAIRVLLIAVKEKISSNVKQKKNTDENFVIHLKKSSQGTSFGLSS